MNYLVFAPKRSGHHAVINWLGYRVADFVTHINNIHEVGNGLVIEPEGQTVQYSNESTEIRGIPSQAVVLSFENPTPERVALWFTHLAAVEKTTRLICVIRDVRNLIASCLRFEESHKKATILLPALEAWRYVAESVVCPLRSEVCATGTILFDYWFADFNYRSAICESLGVVCDDRGLNEVTKFGGGSSFSQRETDGSAQLMRDVLKRYKKYEGSRRYEEAYVEHRELNEKMIGKLWR